MPLLVAVGLAHSLKEFEEQLSTQEEYFQPIDKPAPDFRLQDAEGHVVRLSISAAR
jgi:protein SCO1/2